MCWSPSVPSTLAIKLLPASDLSMVGGYRLGLTLAVSSSWLRSRLCLLVALHLPSVPPARWSWELCAVLSGLCHSPLPGIQAACSWNLSRDSSNFTAKGRCRSLVSEAGFAFLLSPPLLNIDRFWPKKKKNDATVPRCHLPDAGSPGLESSIPETGSWRGRALGELKQHYLLQG